MKIDDRFYGAGSGVPDTDSDLTLAYDFDDDFDDEKTMVELEEDPYSDQIEQNKPEMVLFRKIDSKELVLRGFQFTIGTNASKADYVVSDNRNISRCHAKINYEDGKFYITDMSTNGTWVNGVKLVPNLKTELKEGDTLRLVSEEFEVSINDISSARSSTAAPRPAAGRTKATSNTVPLNKAGNSAGSTARNSARNGTVPDSAASYNRNKDKKKVFIENEIMPSTGLYTALLVFGFFIGILWGALSVSPYNKMKAAIKEGNAAEAWENANSIKKYIIIGIIVNVVIIFLRIMASSAYYY